MKNGRHSYVNQVYLVQYDLGVGTSSPYQECYSWVCCVSYLIYALWPTLAKDPVWKRTCYLRRLR